MSKQLSEKHPELIRYVKPSYIIGNNYISDEVFQLRDDKEPPEEYLSFYHSAFIRDRKKVQDVKNIMEKKGFDCKKTSGFLIINAIEASNDINITKQIIEFKDHSYPHYGLHYVSSNLMDIIEAKTILLLQSRLIRNSELVKIENLNNA